ncbi:MAG: hypothetical protein WA055_00380 [Candidatus Moraniibacteriota bacterium]
MIIANFIKTIKLEISKRENPDIIFLVADRKTKKPKLDEEIIVRMDKEICELFNRKNMKLIELTKNSKRIIDKCDGVMTTEEICKEIYKGFLLNKFTEDSVIFLDKLSKEKFITWK